MDTTGKPHINGGESGLDGSVSDLRNRYFSFNLLLYSHRALLSSTRKIETNTKSKTKQVQKQNTSRAKTGLLKETTYVNAKM